jgi:hypothetical protein
MWGEVGGRCSAADRVCSVEGGVQAFGQERRCSSLSAPVGVCAPQEENEFLREAARALLSSASDPKAPGNGGQPPAEAAVLLQLAAAAPGGGQLPLHLARQHAAQVQHAAPNVERASLK